MSTYQRDRKMNNQLTKATFILEFKICTFSFAVTITMPNLVSVLVERPLYFVFLKKLSPAMEKGVYSFPDAFNFDVAASRYLRT